MLNLRLQFVVLIMLNITVEVAEEMRVFLKGILIIGMVSIKIKFSEVLINTKGIVSTSNTIVFLLVIHVHEIVVVILGNTTWIVGSEVCKWHLLSNVAHQSLLNHLFILLY